MEHYIKKVENDHEIKYIEKCAEITWHNTFDDILPEGQTDYMINKFQSFDAIKKRINEGYIYFIALANRNVPESVMGYCGIKPEADKLFISKVYIRPVYQRTGVATAFFKKLKRDYQDEFSKFYLTVNINNKNAVHTYKKWGFKVKDTAITDIGSGYVMDDYIMEYIV